MRAGPCLRPPARVLKCRLPGQVNVQTPPDFSRLFAGWLPRMAPKPYQDHALFEKPNTVVHKPGHWPLDYRPAPQAPYQPTISRKPRRAGTDGQEDDGRGPIRYRCGQGGRDAGNQIPPWRSSMRIRRRPLPPGRMVEPG